jgi:serine phosphatase RsbU (regulator of sigma subunit)
VASNVPTGSLFTADFRQEFEVETDRLLRQRFLWFTGLLSVYALATAGFFMIFVVIAVWAKARLVSQPMDTQLIKSADSGDIMALINGLVGMAIYGTCFLIAKRRRLSSQAMLRLTFAMVVADGVWRVMLPVMGVSSIGLLGTMVTHVLACGFLPWTTRQAIVPLIPILIVYWARIWIWPNVQSKVPPPDFGTNLFYMVFSLTVGLPGCLICMFRNGRRMETFQLRFVQRRYGEVRRELVDARRIHESLFPRPIDTGPVRFCYEYEPMRQIGGDYLYACVCDDVPAAEGGPGGSMSLASDSGITATLTGQSLNVVLMDVTGHGIPAALTVNRLYGELRRIYAETPSIMPGEVLRLMNRYVNLTLADHSLYVTAMVIRVNSVTNELHYASGGHPPAYVRAVDGTLHELPATTWLLGATDDAHFDSSAASAHFGPGDTLIAYTDGVIESRGKDGRMLGMDGLRKLLSTPERTIEGAWPRRVLATVESYRFGPPQDDALVIEVTRPIGTGSPPSVAPTSGPKSGPKSGPARHTAAQR